MSKIGLEIQISAPGGVPASIPATAEGMRRINEELRITQLLQSSQLGKFSGLSAEAMAETRAFRMGSSARRAVANLEMPGSGAAQTGAASAASSAQKQIPTWNALASAMEQSGNKIERANHGILLLKIAAETESFQAGLDKLGPSFKSLFNDITSGLTGVVMGAQGLRDIASLTKDFGKAQWVAAGAAGLGLAGVGMVKASADSAVEMSDAQTDQASSTNRLFDVANARSKTVQSMDQLNKLIEGIQYDANQLHATGQRDQGQQMQALAQSLLANREAVLARNRLTAEEKAAADEAKARDQQIKAMADSWGETQAALDEATAAAKREALSRSSLAEQIAAAQKDLEKAQAEAKRSQAEWEKTLAESKVDARTKEESREAKKAELQTPVVQAQAALDELQAKEKPARPMSELLDSVRAMDFNPAATPEPKSFHLPADAAVRTGLTVGNVRSNLDVSAANKTAQHMASAVELLKQLVAKPTALPGVPVAQP